VSTTTWKNKRARIARLSKDLPAKHPKLVELRRDLAVQRLGEYIEKVVAAAPPFTAEQIDQLRILLEPVRRDLGIKAGVTR
jgi:hypothetical protein